MEQWDCFRWEQEGHVAHLVLNRGDKRNTMSLRFFDELKSIIEKADDDDNVRAVLISAEGKSFTGGLDLVEATSLFSEPSSQSRHAFRKVIMKLQAPMTALELCRKPVIVAIHSHCIGGGVDMASACDVRLASQDAVFSIRETKMAMVADLGTLQRIAFIVGQGHARELALTGRDFDASGAYRIGFLSRVYPDKNQLLKGAMETAQQIAQLSPLAVQGVKETMNFSRDHGILAGLEYVAQKNAAVLPSEDLMEAFQSFMEKRPPKYKGR